MKSSSLIRLPILQLLPFTVQFFLLTQYVRIEPDPFHSGFVYSQSLAVADGLLPNKNFLSPYGVIGPFVNGFWLRFVDSSMLSLLIFYCLILALSSFIVFLEISRLTDAFTGHLVSFVWILSMATAMPWPSILTSFFTLLSISILTRNREKAIDNTTKAHSYMLPVVLLLDLAVLTRIHLVITPLIISLYIFIRRKSLNPYFVKMWFGLQATIGSSLLILMGWLGILKPYINQAIVWPLTKFENPPMNLSFIFSFIWFPIGLFFITFLTWFNYQIRKIAKNNLIRVLGFVLSLLCFYSFYYFSLYRFTDSDVTTLRTIPGLIKTAAGNMQFVLGYAAGTAAFLGLIFLVFKRENQLKWSNSSVHEFKFMLIVSLAVTGMIQLYPLHDNVHLWFITPLVLIPALYCCKMLVQNFKQYLIPFNIVLASILVIQSFSLVNFLSVPRVQLKSSELQGMYASKDFRDTTDRTMQLLDIHVTERNLRNKCKAGLFSVAERKFRSIDGNFSENFFGLFASSTPIVDPTPNSPEFVFECGIDSIKRNKIIGDGFEIVFEIPHSIHSSGGAQIFNVLFKKNRVS